MAGQSSIVSAQAETTAATATAAMTATAGTAMVTGSVEGSQDGPSTLTRTANCLKSGAVDTDASFVIQDADGQTMLAAMSVGNASPVQVSAVPMQASIEDAKWRLIVDSESSFRLLHVGTMMVLGAAAPATLEADSGGDQHVWRMPVPDANCQVTFTNQLTGKRLGKQNTATAASPSVGPVDQGDGADAWRLLRVADGFPAPRPIGTVGNVFAPTITQGPDGAFLLYYDDGSGNLMMQSGSDGTTFQDPQPLFAQPLSWMTDNFSAGTLKLSEPRIFLAGKTFLLTFTFLGTMGGKNVNGVAIVTSASGRPGTFTDAGKLLEPEYLPESRLPLNPTLAGPPAADPALVLTQLSTDTIISVPYRLSTMDFSAMADHTLTTQSVAARGVAVAHSGMHYRDGQYYLFIENNSYSNWPKYSSLLRVLKASVPTADFVDRGGIKGSQGGGSVLLTTHGPVYGPRHASVLSLPDGDVLLYQYYDEAERPKVGTSKISWTSGWPQLVP